MIDIFKKHHDRFPGSEVERFHVRQNNGQGFIINLTVKLAGGQFGYEFARTLLTAFVIALVMGSMLVLFLNRDQRPIPPERKPVTTRSATNQ